METYKGIKVTENNKAWLTYLAKEDAKKVAFDANLKEISAKGHSTIGNVLGLLVLGFGVVLGIAIPLLILSLVF